MAMLHGAMTHALGKSEKRFLAKSAKSAKKTEENAG
jgi:hypothetical protein